MEIVVIVVVALMFVGVLGLVLLSGASRDRKKSEANASSILDSTFDGRQNVSFSINMGSLKYEDVVIGATERGYELVSQAENKYGPHTLIFAKR